MLLNFSQKLKVLAHFLLCFPCTIADINFDSNMSIGAVGRSYSSTAMLGQTVKKPQQAPELHPLIEKSLISNGAHGSHTRYWSPNHYHLKKCNCSALYCTLKPWASSPTQGRYYISVMFWFDLILKLIRTDTILSRRALCTARMCFTWTGPKPLLMDIAVGFT